MSSAQLVTKRGPASMPAYDLLEQTMVLGRDAINDIILNDLEISRRHAAVTFRSGRYFVEDLGSTNGTFVNGRRVAVATPLKHGDIIDLAQSVSLTFQWPEDPAAGLGRLAEEAADIEDTAADFDLAPEKIEPVAQARLDEAISLDPEEAPGPSWRERLAERRFLAGCGFLLLAVVAGCVASALLLDALAPETLYCGPLEPLFEVIGTNLSCP